MYQRPRESKLSANDCTQDFAPPYNTTKGLQEEQKKKTWTRQDYSRDWVKTLDTHHSVFRGNTKRLHGHTGREGLSDPGPQIASNQLEGIGKVKTRSSRLANLA